MLNSTDYAQALTCAEQAIDENGCRDADDIEAHVDGIAQMYGDEIANEARVIICELLNHRNYSRDIAGPWIK
jgi:hypothetical protein